MTAERRRRAGSGERRRCAEAVAAGSWTSSRVAFASAPLPFARCSGVCRAKRACGLELGAGELGTSTAAQVPTREDARWPWCLQGAYVLIVKGAGRLDGLALAARVVKGNGDDGCFFQRCEVEQE